MSQPLERRGSQTFEPVKIDEHFAQKAGKDGRISRKSLKVRRLTSTLC